MIESGLLHDNHPEINLLHKKLTTKSKDLLSASFHLKALCRQKNRFSEFSLKSKGFFLDFSRQRLDKTTVSLLLDLAKTTRVLERFRDMSAGEIVNVTENRAALHMTARGSGKGTIKIDGMDVRAEIDRVNNEIQSFVQKVHDHEITGATGLPFSDAVVVGIGGSYLGCQFVHEAMTLSMPTRLRLHFLPNVDIDNFAGIIKEINPATTLWIVISKSYTTTETMANLNQALRFLKTQGLKPESHVVTVTAKGSPGDDPKTPVLASFHMFDFIGGRYSVSSAVGGVPLSLAFGFKGFQRFLNGCKIMDEHALSAPEDKNIPLRAALISIWNTIFLNYPAQAVIPYASRLSKLAAHVQQVYMESVGKSVSLGGDTLTRPAGTIIFGEPGTNAQHSFFQLAHQGPAFPIDFIGVVKPGYTGHQAKSKGVTNHQELWANLLAQSKALAFGQENENPARQFSGNRPSSIIMVNDLEPESIGQLLAFYEARTIFEGFMLGINPFDQFGVELGKVMASDIRDEIADRNQNSDHNFSCPDESERFYLNKLFGQD